MGVKLLESTHDDGSHYAWLFFCHGCQSVHFFDTRWTFNGNKEAPTFRPSLLVYEQPAAGYPRCHSFVTDGRIEFLSDSAHSLAGKTVDLPDECGWWEKDQAGYVEEAYR